MRLTFNQLLIDLHTAYLDARRHKRSRSYQQRFEADMEQNLRQLANELYSRTYRPQPSTCFIIEDPKKREVFAARFRDRIVHHLYYNYTHELFERTFIADSYSCIKKRGTHYGIARLEKHIRQESLNYTEKAYILKMDISGYFMRINRQLLLEICQKHLAKMRNHPVAKNNPETWDNRIDFDFISYLSEVIIMLNPIENCRMVGSPADWRNLPRNKSLFNSPAGCGLPIGNLTSQLFSNVYMGEFDQFVKRRLKCRHYGRYVDDFFIVSADRQWLCSQIPIITDFLERNLELSVNQGKTRICDSQHGVEFLGAYLKPHRRYVSNTTLARMRRKLPRLNAITTSIRMQSAVNSYLGLLSHYKTHGIRRLFFQSVANIQRFGCFTLNWRRFQLH